MLVLLFMLVIHKSILIEQKGNTRRDWYSHDVVLHADRSKFFDVKFDNDEFKDIDFINEIEPCTNRVININKFSTRFTCKGDTKLKQAIDYDKSS